jgi:hypothetical protein
MSSPPGLRPMVRRSPKKSISTEKVRQKVSYGRKTTARRGQAHSNVSATHCRCVRLITTSTQKQRQGLTTAGHVRVFVRLCTVQGLPY